MSRDFHRIVEKLYREQSSRVLATLVRLLGDLDLAEELLQEAFSIAMQQWPEAGIPENPYAWLVSVAKHKGIDRLRRQRKGEQIHAEIASIGATLETRTGFESEPLAKHFVEDDLLRLIFLCCHPDLPIEARIALALKDVCGMSTEEIAKAYLTSMEATKKRLSRAKAFIKTKQLALELPNSQALRYRSLSVLRVIYLIYNEGYSASSGENYIRRELTEKAIYLARQMVALSTATESMGLLALLLIQESRRDARISETGELIPLEQQDRALWNGGMIQEGIALIQQVVLAGRLGPYTLQAAIASVHAVAPSVKDTQWELIIGYYDLLLKMEPSPIVKLHRAIAVGMHEGPQAGLDLINALRDTKLLKNYHILYSTEAEFYKRLGNQPAARRSLEIAIRFAPQAAEKQYLKKQLEKI